jgi:hypothetical protein
MRRAMRFACDHFDKLSAMEQLFPKSKPINIVAPAGVLYYKNR